MSIGETRPGVSGPSRPDAAIGAASREQPCDPCSLAEALHRVRGKVNASRSSFFWAMRLLPKPRRDAMYAVYAFCRAVDDIADGDGSAEDKTSALAGWRGEVSALFAGVPREPVAIALADAVSRYDLDQSDFLAVIDGMEMDVAETMVAPSLEQLRLYCTRVACAVGNLSVAIFGLQPAQGRPLAAELGQALQLTNVLRDLAEDAAAGRLYLPRESLDAAGIAVRRPAEVLKHPALGRACGEVAAMAEAHYAAAQNILAQCPRAARRPALTMYTVYRRLLARLTARGFAPQAVASPVHISRFEKFAVVVQSALAR